MTMPSPLTILFPYTTLFRSNVMGAAAVTWRQEWSARALETMIALAAGFMIAASVTDIFPEAIARGGSTAALVDRKSTRLNSSHLVISYAVFCLKKKNIHLID